MNIDKDGKVLEPEVRYSAIKNIANKHGVKGKDLKALFAPKVGEVFEVNGNKFKVVYVRDDLRFSAEFVGFSNETKESISNG